MPWEESLCIDDLVDKAVQEDLAHENDGSIECLSYSEDVFITSGIKSSQGEVPLYYLSALDVVFDHQYSPPSWIRLLLDKAKNLRGSITVSVIWIASYKNNLQGQAIYKPTEEELKAYERNPHSKRHSIHTMSLTGAGVHEEDDGTLIPYFEILDSIGDIGVGDRGFLRFDYACPIVEFVEMTL